MEGALLSAATGALKPVLEKLGALLGDEYKRIKGVRDQIRFLTNELAAMHAFLTKMSAEEEEGHDAQDKAWMKEVRELSYDMEDSIDEFMQHVDDKDAKPDGFIDKIKHSLGKLGKMKTRRRIGKEIEDLKKQIIEVAERNARYKTCEVFSKTSNATVDPRALAIFEHVSKLVGIDEPKAEIIKLLMEEDGCLSTQQQLKVLSVVGSGGMGKTTLVNQVYQELKGKFQCRAFISVSRTPDMVNILRTILSEVSNQRYADTEAGSIQHLMSKIHDFLIDKRYLIVVDDIWNVKTWDIIKCAFPGTSDGSRIITTTRVKVVAHSCCSSFGGHVYSIRPLNMEYSRQLFHRRLFNSEEDCPSHLQEVSDEILKKCDGLPLAIIAISGLLANRANTKYQWDQVKNSIGCALERNPSVEGMIKILSLSYFDLPPHLKTCLLYLSIFPEDSFIEKDGLVRRWIAEGFICREGKYTLYELGERCFNELINRSLIQPILTDMIDTVMTCRVHDIILDFIISKSIEENFVTLLGVPNPSTGTQSKVRRISLQVDKQENSVPMNGLILSHVRSLNVFADWAEIPSLDRFMHLRLLDFGYRYELGNHHLANIGRLFQLRYLNLRSTGVTELLERIGDLWCLEMLDLRDTKVRELPASIVNLEQLVELHVNVNVKLPDGISKMQALEVLEMVRVSQQSFNFLQELCQLKNLRKLWLDFKDAKGDTKASMRAIESSLWNVRSLIIWNDGNFLLEPCCPPRSLQKLEVSLSTIPQVPSSVGSLINLQVLSIWMDGVRQEDLCILGGLPALLNLILVIIKCKDSPRNKVTVSGADGFRCLRVFFYHLWNDGMDLTFAAGSMPKLEILDIQFNAAKTESLSGDDVDFGIENLPCLTTLRCGVYGPGESVEATKAAMERAVDTHPNHPRLRFRKSPYLPHYSQIFLAQPTMLQSNARLGWSIRSRGAQRTMLQRTRDPGGVGEPVNEPVDGVGLGGGDATSMLRGPHDENCYEEVGERNMFWSH